MVASELLARALALPPVGCEDLVLRLLAAMGHGNAGRVERTSAAIDAGVDGIISQDPLGLDRIYVQAKRYDSQRVVHGPTIQSLVGALKVIVASSSRPAASGDHHCTAEGCDAPAARCHVHHDNPWALGGHTTVTEGRLLCPRHHRAVHDPARSVKLRS